MVRLAPDLESVHCVLLCFVNELLLAIARRLCSALLCCWRNGDEGNAAAATQQQMSSKNTGRWCRGAQLDALALDRSCCLLLLLLLAARRDFLCERSSAFGCVCLQDVCDMNTCARSATPTSMPSPTCQASPAKREQQTRSSSSDDDNEKRLPIAKATLRRKV